MRKMRPGVRAGFAGMALVAAYYVAHAMLLNYTGHGLGAAGVAGLPLPGVLAARICAREGRDCSPAREGVVAGVVTAHFLAALQIVMLVVGVLLIDWGRYTERVGPEIAAGVREAAWPAAAVAGTIVVILAYAGSTLASWLGATTYAGYDSWRQARKQESNTEGARGREELGTR